MTASKKKAPELTAGDVMGELQRLPRSHPLCAVASYRDGFVRAFLNIHRSQPNALALLRQRFLGSGGDAEDRYQQAAAELTVANHVQGCAVQDFATDKKMNPPAKTDVDVYYRLGPIKVGIEVKSPVEKPVPANVPVLDSAGRHPEFTRIASELTEVMKGANLPPELSQLAIAQHKDNKLKDFLVSAQTKFPATEDLDELHALLVACGEELMPWHSYLTEHQGLFTPNSFHPVSEMSHTQVVLLSNLKYFHTTAVAHHDWTLKNVFLLPIINPYAEPRLMTNTLYGGLSILDHHLRQFAAFDPGAASPQLPGHVSAAVKVNHYIHGILDDATFARFFPCTPRRRAR